MGTPIYLLSTSETQTILTKPTEDRLLTDEEYFAAFEEPVVEGHSPSWNIAIAQDAKTAEFFQAQVDAAEADAARSMAAYKDANAATQLLAQMLEENKTKVTSYETARQQNSKTT